jgi:hypothetical protein
VGEGVWRAVSLEGLTPIDTDDTDLRTGNGKGKYRNNDEIQGSFAPLRMTTKTGNSNDRNKQQQQQQQTQKQKQKQISSLRYGMTNKG